MVDGWEEAMVISNRFVKKRAISQSQPEQVIRGPREGFIEMLMTNLSLLRYRLPTADFRVKMMKVGRMTVDVTVSPWIRRAGMMVR
ncbi:hypothetical protein EL26_24405 [Tumebacillus flagellatus]|uniref:Uncharacterized protein n=1 Tax=Tumebacillus flagellatus TaxID=1157490 RepID=A0A074LJM0_9BACL|nr:hypothetical protein EL26_24405 [Tumebacillus flagellatus]